MHTHLSHTLPPIKAHCPIFPYSATLSVLVLPSIPCPSILNITFSLFLCIAFSFSLPKYLSFSLTVTLSVYLLPSLTFFFFYLLLCSYQNSVWERSETCCVFLIQADYKDKRPCFFNSLGDDVDKDGTRRDRKRKKRRDIPSYPAINKLLPLLCPLSTPSLCVFLSLSHFSGKCVLSLERPTGGKAEGGGRVTLRE